MRRRTSRGSLLVTLLALSALVLSFAAPAQAQPAPPPGDDTPDDTVEQENQGRDSADIGEYDYYSIDECRAQFSGENEGTKYKNHFASCQIDWGIYVHNACVDDVCGEVGRQKFRMTQIGFGSRTQQTMRFETAIDAWQPEGLINDSAPFSAQYLCANRLETDSCTSTNPGVVTRSIGEWKANPTMPNVVFDTSASVGGGDGQHRDADRVNYHTLRFLTVGSDPGVHETITPFRCDAATYLRASGACIFHTVDAVHKVSVLPEDGTQEVALHIMTALGSPDQTFPEVADKFIPGSLQDVVPLTRLYSGYDDNSQRDRNRATARATCVAEWGAHYSRGPQGPRDCDEFPFASTFEGAYRSLILPELGSYSANVINSAQNQRHGRELGKYYVEDHILHGDRFFVQVTGCDGCGGDPPPKPPVGNTPPTVDAGPDVNATEGGSVALAGSVTDPDDTPPSTGPTRSALTPTRA